MSRVAALLAAALLAAGAAGCGGSGAEPGAPDGATLVLDFTPNAVHSGIYAARAQGFYRDAGVDLSIRVPGESTDAPKLLEAGRADFAILDIHDLGIAREHGFDIVGAMPIVQRPLAAVLARGDGPVRRPRDLEGHSVGVTGLPSDEAVVDSEVSADGGDPAQVHRVTIGFNAVASLAAGKVDAATGFWNAEGVALRGEGIPIRVFKVDEYGAPPYPELVLTASRKTIEPGRTWSTRWSTPRPAATASRSRIPPRRSTTWSRPTRPSTAPNRPPRCGPLGPDLRPAPFDPRAGPGRLGTRHGLGPSRHGLLERPLDVEQAARPTPEARAPSASGGRPGRSRPPRLRAGSRRRRASSSRAPARPARPAPPGSRRRGRRRSARPRRAAPRPATARGSASWPAAVEHALDLAAQQEVG